ncbi:MAG TPA: dienelactone hydrolase family protein [Acidimicrobiales bacterium]|nr:dienelactone hydrolase family protein [Acidimicrobiales bacterium]
MTAYGSALEGFSRGSFTARGKSRDVYRMGAGPAVIVISELPGITPLVAAFGRRVADAGCTAVMPHLFGDPGRPPTAGYLLKSTSYACISREFAMFAKRKTSPVTDWLRDLARAEHESCGGPGVGVVGMCLTGGFALAMMVDDVVLAPVLSQPSLPAGLNASFRSDLGISDGDLARVKERCAGGQQVLGLRFTGDTLSPPDRFERLRGELGDAFIGVEIDSSKGNPDGYRTAAHSVLTEDLKDDDGSASKGALDQVIGFFREKLAVTG